jgi:hypothetical protein
MDERIKITAEMVDRAATVLANARGARRGQAPLRNIRDIVGAKRWGELLSDSQACLQAALRRDPD